MPLLNVIADQWRLIWSLEFSNALSIFVLSQQQHIANASDFSDLPRRGNVKYTSDSYFAHLSYKINPKSGILPSDDTFRYLMFVALMLGELEWHLAFWIVAPANFSAQLYREVSYCDVCPQKILILFQAAASLSPSIRKWDKIVVVSVSKAWMDGPKTRMRIRITLWDWSYQC